MSTTTMPPLAVKVFASALWPVAVVITGALVGADALVRVWRNR